MREGKGFPSFIPKEKIETIFDSFSQVSSTTTRRFGGTGLGLSITKKLVEIQGGNISVKSTVGVGTTFFFILKFKRGNEKNLKKLNNLKDIAIQPLGKLRILLAEDNPLNQVVAKDTIKKWGKNITINIANDGIEAIDMLRAEKYDLVLMDVQMPRMNGLNTTRHIRTVLKLTDLPILAMTAYATTGEAEKTIMAGMNDYISKPFNPKKLYEKIYTLTKDKHIDAEPLEEEAATKPKSTKKSEQNTSITDFSFLNEAVGNDPELKKQMLEIMLQETPEETMQMRIFLKKEDWSRLRSVAHKFKSAVTYMGLHNLKEVVKTIQENVDLKGIFEFDGEKEPSPLSKLYKGTFNKSGDYIEAAYGEKTDSGWVTRGSRSKIHNRTFANNPLAGNGTGPNIVCFEEVGFFANLIDSLGSMKDATYDGTFKFGTIYMFGTGGDMEGGSSEQARGKAPAKVRP